jgi:hypothetical protein
MGRPSEQCDIFKIYYSLWAKSILWYKYRFRCVFFYIKKNRMVDRMANFLNEEGRAYPWALSSKSNIYHIYK